MKFYTCSECGKVVIHLDRGDEAQLGEGLVELVPGTSDGALEKHVLAVTVEGDSVTVAVGSVHHPMLDEHFIQWVVLETTGGMQQKRLNPGEEPVANFKLVEGEKPLAAYEYCNLHGLWKADV